MRGPRRAEVDLGGAQKRKGWRKKGWKRQRARWGASPTCRGALRAHTCAIGLVRQRWRPASSLVPQSLPLSSCNPSQQGGWGADGQLVDQAPSSCLGALWGLMPRAGVSEEQDGLGWPRNSLHLVGGVEEPRNQPALLFALLDKRWAGCLGQRGQSSEGGLW